MSAQEIPVWVNLDMVRTMVRTNLGTRMRFSPNEDDVAYAKETPEQILGMGANLHEDSQAPSVSEDFGRIF
jgi:hypothetical protein